MSSQIRERLQVLVLERIDCEQRMARYYVLAIEPTLFGEVSLTREWGRLGSAPRRRVELHAGAADAGVALEKWLRRKQRRGYAARG
jgi:predicted DNA-binding WGR domain protein